LLLCFEMNDDELNDELGPFSKLKLSPEQQSSDKPPPVNMTNFEDLFLNLSVSKGGGDISLAVLENVVLRMKANAHDSISLATLLTELHISQEPNAHQHSDPPCQGDTAESIPATSAPEKESTTVPRDDQDTSDVNANEKQDEEDDESISSSLNSSWAESPFRHASPSFSFHSSPLNDKPSSSSSSPPIKFDFKTPQKIFNARKKAAAAAEEKPPSPLVPPPNDGSSSSTTSSPGFVVDSSPPPNFFDRNVSASCSGSVFGPPDEALLPNKRNKEVPVARTLFGNTTDDGGSKAPAEPLLASSLFSGDGEAPSVTFDMGKSSESKATGRGSKLKKNSKARGGKAQMSKNLPTTNFQAFTQQQQQHAPPPPPPSAQQSSANPPLFKNHFPPQPPASQSFPSPSPMDMDQSPSDHNTRESETDSDPTTTQPSSASFSFSMGSGATSSSKVRSGIKDSQRKSRRGKTSPAASASASASANSSDANPPSGFYTSPIKSHPSSSSSSFSIPQPEAAASEEEPEVADREEVDSRMYALAELFKKEGKQLYSMERYDM
jgi:hypothetical protein